MPATFMTTATATPLSQFQTLEQLLDALKAEGYRQVPSGTFEPRARRVVIPPVEQPSEPHYRLNPEYSTIDIFPGIEGEHAGSFHVQVEHDADGRLKKGEWIRAETYAGKWEYINPRAVTLQGLAAFLLDQYTTA